MLEVIEVVVEPDVPLVICVKMAIYNHILMLVIFYQQHKQ